MSSLIDDQILQSTALSQALWIKTFKENAQERNVSTTHVTLIPPP